MLLSISHLLFFPPSTPIWFLFLPFSSNRFWQSNGHFHTPRSGSLISCYLTSGALDTSFLPHGIITTWIKLDVCRYRVRLVPDYVCMAQVCRAGLYILSPQICFGQWRSLFQRHPVFPLMWVLAPYEDTLQIKIIWGPQSTCAPRPSLERGLIDPRYPLRDP